MIEVTAAIMMRGNEVFIARRKPGIKYAGKWEFPGGKIEKGETPEQCLKREIYEEFNIIIEVGKLFEESSYHSGDSNAHIRSYTVKWISGEMILKDHDECQWVLVENLMQYDLLMGDIPFAKKLLCSIC